MPRFDWQCQVCNDIVESDTQLQCCGAPMAKLFSPPAIHFKGKGWGHQ